MARIPDLEKGQTVHFTRGPESESGPKPRRYEGRVKETMADAVRLIVTDSKWGGSKETIVRYRDLIDPETGEKFSVSAKKAKTAPVVDTTIAPPSPPESLIKSELELQREVVETVDRALHETVDRKDEEPSGEVRFAKTDLDTWLAMGRDMLGSIDGMIEDKKLEIALVEEDIKALIDQRNQAQADIKELEKKRKLLQQFYGGEKE